MREVFSSALDRAQHAAGLLLDHAVAVDPCWLLAGVALHVAAQVVRIRGWWNILLAAYPGARGTLRHRDVTQAYLAGAGINGLLPARAGDLVKYAFLHRRIDGASYATLAASSVPESLCESLFGIALVIWMLALGFLPVPVAPGDVPLPDASFAVEHPVLSVVLASAAAFGIAALLGGARRRSRALWLRLRQGVAILRAPRRFLTGVATWQLLGRIVRLGSLACFLRAFGLPATPGAALLVMAAQSGGRVIPLAPVSTGLRLTMLIYGLVEITGRPVDPGAIAVFTFGVSATLFVTMLAISLVLVAREVGTRSPRVALRAVRERVTRSGAPASADLCSACRPAPSSAPGSGGSSAVRWWSSRPRARSSRRA